MKHSLRGVLIAVLASSATIGVLGMSPLASQPATPAPQAQVAAPTQLAPVSPVAAPPPTSAPTPLTLQDLQKEGKEIAKSVKDDAKSQAWWSFVGTLVVAALAVLGNFGLQYQRLKQENKLATDRLTQEDNLAGNRLQQDDKLARARLQQEDTLAKSRLEFEGSSASRKAALEAAQSLIELRVRQMGELYGPLRALLAQSKGVYDQLTDHLEKTDKEKRYRHVKENPVTGKVGFQFRPTEHDEWRFFALLAQMPRLFKDHESAIPLINEVVFIGEKIVEVIRSNAGRVLPIQPALTAALGEYLSHFVVLKEMHTTLTNKGTPREYHVGFYPRRLNQLVDGGFDLISNELSRWEERLQRTFTGVGDEVLMEGDDTIAYYNREADSYVARTLHANLSAVYHEFLAKIPKGERILDVGSGSGRDLIAFRTHKYEPFGIEPSRELALRARAISGEEVRIMRIDELCWPGLFGGVWALGSLHHLKRTALPGALVKLAEQLAPGAPLFFSVSEGPGEKTLSDGRFFVNYKTEEIEEILKAVPALKSAKVWTTPDTDPGRKGVTWINALATKV